MLTHERMSRLADFVTRERRVTFERLLEKFSVSQATLRRDLARLEADGRIVRVHGGALSPACARGEPTLDVKRSKAIPAKRAIAEAAAKLVPDVGTVFVDAGTTCHAVARLLLDRPNLQIFTNSVALLSERAPRARIIAVGGELRSISGALTGAMALAWLDHLQADCAFLGASGLDATGASTTEPAEAAVKQAFLARSKRRLLLADSSKWDRPAAVRFCAWDRVDTWITDVGFPAATVRKISAQGPTILRVTT